jgi:hypothetical protein
MRQLRSIGPLAFIALASVLAASAQERSTSSGFAEQRHYVPKLAELMTITQARFATLTYAPERNNWRLAAYEAAHLRKSFELAVELYPVFRGIQQAKLIADDRPCPEWN